jgi:endonuclease I
MKRIILLALVLVAVSLIWGQYIVNFEGTGETKIAYASGTVSLSGISWDMTEALIGTDAADWKNGSRSTRMRGYGTSVISMLANKANGLGTLSFYYRRYGTDAQVNWKAEYSLDDGGSWIQIGSSFTAPASDVVQQFTEAVNVSGNVRVRIKRATETGASNNRLNIDDITLTDYAGLTSPTVTTTTVTDITTTTATSGGNVTSDGGATVTARGVCWNTSANPTISNFISSDGSGTGSFVSNLTNLTASTLYYYRAYATNSQGTAYGEEYSFSTSGNSPPAVPTATAATNVGINSFTANWNAASGATSYRLDVSTTNSFGTMLSGYNNLTVNSTSQAVSGLSASTNYYYRVRAYNSIGTSSNSNTITATTLANDPYSGYYNSVSGLSGAALKDGLHTILHSTHTTQFSYTAVTDKLKITDEDPNNSNNVIEIYTGWSVPKSSYGGDVTDWNKEHTWSKSHGDFGDTAPAGTDIHHLRPCDATVNSAKNNRCFDYGSTSYTDASPPSGYTGDTGCKTATDIWEPRDADKGDVARMIFYMAVRYDGGDTSYDLELVDYIPSGSSSEPIYGKLSTLLSWHASDPPDAWEALRNNRIQSQQGNRNPFIDHPEYVSSIWGGAVPPTTVQFNPTSAQVNEADGSVILTVEITNPSASVATTAQIVLSSGSASDVGSYSTRTLTFPVNSSANQTTSITITDDSLLEGTETLMFSLANVSGGNNAVIGTNGSFTLEIVDNDIPTPVATAATNVGFTGFTANWNAASGITDYQFDLSTASNFSSFVGAYQNYPVSNTSVVIGSLSEGTNYYYRVKAIYNLNAGAYSSPITVTTSAIVVLDPPLATDATAISHEGFTSRWDAVTGAENYRLDVLTGTLVDSELSTGFEGSTSFPAGWTNGNAYIQNIQAQANTGSYYAGLNLVDKYFYTPLVTNPTTCSFWARNSASSANCTIKVQTSSNGNDWTDRASYSAIPTDAGTVISTYTQKTINLNLTGDYYVRWYMSARSGGSIYIDDIVIGCQTGSLAYVSGYENLTVNTNVARISGLEPETTYTYRVRAQNSSYTSTNSNTIEALTTATVQGTSANTAISGAATTVLIPALTGFSNNDVTIDPGVSSSDDFSVTAATITGGIRYSITSSNVSAMNAAYILNHAGLGFTPASIMYHFNSIEHSASTFTANASQTSVTLSGISGTGTLEIDLLSTPQNLDKPVLTISVAGDMVTLDWEVVPNATSYRIESCDTPYGTYTLETTTDLLTWSHSSGAKGFYRVIAIR